MSDHFLRLFDEEDGILSWEIEHPNNCPTEIIGAIGDPDRSYMRHTCAFEWEVEQAGSNVFDPFPKEVGQYRIEHWVEKVRYPWIGEEITTGIAVETEHV